MELIKNIIIKKLICLIYMLYSMLIIKYTKIPFLFLYFKEYFLNLKIKLSHLIIINITMLLINNYLGKILQKILL